VVKIPLQPTSIAKASLAASLDPAFAEPLILPYTVLIDHREREGGWRFQGLTGDAKEKYRPLIVPQKEVHLVTADYSIEGVPVFVERKSHDDIIGSIGGGHGNFRKEHERMHEIVALGGACCVIIESSYDAVMTELEDPLSMRRLEPAAVEGVLASWPVACKVPWFWAGTRRRAESLAMKFLRTWYSKLTSEGVRS
jgi:ERCC4-type nuclease